MADVIDFSSRNKTPETPPAPPSVVKSGKFEFTIHGTDEEHSPEPVKAEGYLKFGPAFIAVVDGPDDQSNVLFAIQTQMVKHVRRLDDDNTIQATLSL